MSELSRLMEFASALARDAGAIALRYFQTELEVRQKADRSPVTVADRESEELVWKRIQEAFPDDGILGEELGEKVGSSGRRWLVDPIDGTKSFIQGVPLFGVMIGLEGPDGPEVGVVFLPALDELVCAARGEGTWWNGHRARVSAVDELSRACIAYTSMENFENAGNGVCRTWEELRRASRLQRGWGDCYGHILVATGRAEAMLDPILNPWDCGPLPTILEEAGGTFTDWKGQRTIRGGNGVSTNGQLLEPILAILCPADRPEIEKRDTGKAVTEKRSRP